MDTHDGGSGRRRWQVVETAPGEGPPLLWSAACHFLLLASYYLLRPVRDEISAADREHLQVLWTGTFLAMLVAAPLFAALVSRAPRGVFVPWVYRFFVANLLAFRLGWMGLGEVARCWLDRGFYVWTSVFNLFVVSVFWALMADTWRSEQGKRLFGAIALGGTLGAVTGSALTAHFAVAIGPANLVLVSAGFLLLAASCVRGLRRRVAQAPAGTFAEQRALDPEPVAGTVRDGLLEVVLSPYLRAACGYLLLFTMASTFAYFLQAHVVGEAFGDRAVRTAFFGRVDLAVNVLTAFGQLFIAGRALGRLGVGITLAVLPACSALGFATLAAAPVLAVLVAFQVVRRSANYALAKPAREVLFTVVPRGQKYRAKPFIDTVVYRGGDMAAGWVFAGLRSLGLGIAALALTAVPLGVAWAALGLDLGRRQERLAGLQGAPPAPAPPPAGTIP